ncbi:MAG TPA: hypothetical protein PKE51_05340 [Gemmatimonadaceae bacterium]|nr:hypothetical protein [Gemmatimonadaceae bacterium]
MSLPAHVRVTTRLTCALLLVACTSDGSRTANPSAPVVERETIGDTMVIRTVRGSAWGDRARLTPVVSIGALDGDERYIFGNVFAIARDSLNRVLVLDGQANAIRVYNADGTYADTWGREGAGPGELRNPDRGLAVLPDGRTVVRDPGNARLQLFTRDGASDGVWLVLSGQWRSRDPLFQHADTLLTLQPAGEVRDISDVPMALVRIAPNGTVFDTLPLPALGAPVPQLTARNGGNTAQIAVPWAPGPVWTWHPAGYFVTGHAERYAITFADPSGVRRVERAVAPIRITEGERTQEIARATAGLRWLDSSWVWNGPDVPTEKPAFERFYVATDGRLWVLRAGDAVALDTPERDENGVEIAWAEQQLFDVFERDGSFLGSVPVPMGFKHDRSPVIDGDGLWAVWDAATGEQRVVRFALTLDQAVP